MPAKIASSKLRNKSQSQISSHNFASLKLQITKKEGVNKKLTTNGNEGIKLIEAIEEAKDAKDAEEADEADVYKEEAREQKESSQWRSQRSFQNMFGMKLGPDSKRFAHLNSKKGNMINPLHREEEKTKLL